MANVISVLTSKGGVGKTQTALEVASVLANNGNRVLCIDMDGQKNLSKRVGCDLKKKTILDCLTIDEDISLEDMEELLSKSIQHVNNLDIIAGNTKMGLAEKIFPGADDVFLLDAFCKSFVKDDYDFIIIDNPPARSVITTMSIIASDYAILVTDGSSDARDGIQIVLTDIATFKLDERRKWSNIEILGIVINKAKMRTVHFITEVQAYKEDVVPMIEEKGLGKNLFVQTVSDAIEVMEAGDAKKSLQDYKRYGEPAKDFRKVAAEVLKRII